MKQPHSGILITGGSGFLGRGLAPRLLEDGWGRVCIFSRNEFAQAQMRREFKNDPRLRWFIGDVRDRDRLERAMQGVSAVIHAAALKRIEVGAYCPDEMVKTNVDGSTNVIEAARRADVERVLLISSDKAFEPVSPYGFTKATAEWLFLTANDISPYGPRYAVCRYGNVAGSTGSVIPTWRELALQGEEASLTDPDCTRFYMTRDEAVTLVLNTLRDMVGGEVAVPTLPAFRLGDLAQAMGVKYRVTGLGEYEKRHESLDSGVSSEKARRMTVEELSGALEKV